MRSNRHAKQDLIVKTGMVAIIEMFQPDCILSSINLIGYKTKKEFYLFDSFFPDTFLFQNETYSGYFVKEIQNKGIFKYLKEKYFRWIGNYKINLFCMR